MLFVLAAAIWLASFHLGGDGSIWRVGYAFATTNYQQAGCRTNTLGNLDGVMEQKFGWKMQDPLSDFHLPISDAHIQWNMGQTLTAIYFFSAIACAAGAAMQIRKRDPKFLIALAAPWMLAATLISPMPSSFMILPAILAAGFIGVSTGMSLLQFMLMIVGCVMILAQFLAVQLAPATFGMVRPTAPDLGWMMPLAAAVVPLHDPSSQPDRSTRRIKPRDRQRGKNPTLIHPGLDAGSSVHPCHLCVGDVGGDSIPQGSLVRNADDPVLRDGQRISPGKQCDPRGRAASRRCPATPTCWSISRPR